MKLKQGLQDAAISLSLANLFFIGAWIPLLDRSYNWALKFLAYNVNNLVALIFDIGLLGVILFFALTLTHRLQNEVLRQGARWIFFLLCLAIFGIACGSQFPTAFSHVTALTSHLEGYLGVTEMRVIGAIIVAASAVAICRRHRYWIAGLLSLFFFLVARTDGQVVILLPIHLLALLAIRWDRLAFQAVRALSLIFFPFALFTVFQGTVFLFQVTGRQQVAPLQMATNPPPRIVWIVFDEMDYSVLMAKRPASLKLPELDRLRGQSLWAQNAYPPAGYTLMTMPALITGRLVSKVRPVNPSSLLLQYDGSDEAVNFSSQANLFSRARELGVSSAVIGWYLPYDRLIGNNLSKCRFQDVGMLSIPKSMLLHLQAPLQAAACSGLADRLDKKSSLWHRQRNLQIYLQALEESKQVVANPDLGLLLLHLPIPHPPGLFNRATGEFEVEAESSYLDNLALADRTLGDLRRLMETAGVWDRSVLLVTSDHWWRPYIWRTTPPWSREDGELADELADREGKMDHRVPFILKMPGQSTPLAFDPAFNTVLTHDLLLTILRGETTSAEGAKQWLEQNRSIADSPYCFEEMKEE